MSDNPENLPARSDDRFLPARVDHVSGTLSMIKTALDKGIDAEGLGKLLDLQDRVLAKQAEADFADAKRRFQAKCPIITKNRTADIRKKDGGSSHSYTFADLAHVAASIQPLLNEFGFSYSFNQTHNDKGMIEVACIVRHVSGHKESTTFTAPSDSAAAMSSAQKYAAATTFARRYALVLAFGLPIGEDNDGREPEHDKPDQRKGAPKPAPRDQRQRQTDTQTDDQQGDADDIDASQVVIEPAELDRLIKEWKTQQPGSPGKPEFTAWALATVPDDWNPGRLLGWTRERADKCWAKLGVPT